MPGLEQDLVVEGLPLRVVTHGNGELAQAGHQVLGHPELVRLLPPEGVLQLKNNVYDNHDNRNRFIALESITGPLFVHLLISYYFEHYAIKYIFLLESKII